ncbi:hypothetical protein C8R45DRAFT_1036220 [Mycena sanguinolenta]|nr:hypothetical protein C8R45DRAFT_1036220 [Mycena sanguinolenta]
MAFFLSDPVQPHSYGFLCNGVHLWILVKRKSTFLSFYLSEPLPFTHPDLLRILTFTFFGDPPSDLIAPDTSTPSVIWPSAPKITKSRKSSKKARTTKASTPSSAHASSLKIIFTQSLDRPGKQFLLQTGYPTFGDLNDVVLTSFDPAPRQKRDEEKRIQEEARVYRERLRGLQGVPTLYAEGYMMTDNGDPAYCLLLEDLGTPVVSEGIEDLESLDEPSRKQLRKIEDGLRARGVIHLDLEPRNVLRTRSGGVAVVDFEEVELMPIPTHID